MYFKTQAGDLTGYFLKSIFIPKNQRNLVSNCWRCRSVANTTNEEKGKEGQRGTERRLRRLNHTKLTHTVLLTTF